MMNVSYDTEAEATYVRVVPADVKIARTVHLSDLVMVDVDEHRDPVGVEFVVLPHEITDAMLDRVSDAFPTLKSLHHKDTWLYASH